MKCKKCGAEKLCLVCDDVIVDDALILQGYLDSFWHVFKNICLGTKSEEVSSEDYMLLMLDFLKDKIEEESELN